MSKSTAIRVGPLSCRLDRRRSHIDHPDLRYWRIFYKNATVWSGWETVQGVTTTAAQLVANDNFVPVTQGRPRTVGQLLRVWASNYRSRKDISAGTIDIKRRNLRHLIEHLDDIALTEVGQDDIDNYRDARIAEGHAPSTIIVEHRTLGQAWKWGKKRGFVSGTVPPLTIQEYRVHNHRTPTDAEIDLVIERLGNRATRRSNGARWPRMFVLIEKETGARLCEVGTLIWRRVDLDNAKITLLGKRTRKDRRKEHQPRTIPISTGLVGELRQWAMQVGHRTPERPVLGVGHKTCRSRGIWHIKEACWEVGIEPFTNHGLRRRAIRRFRKAGCR